MDARSPLTPGLSAKATLDSFEALNGMSPAWEQDHAQIGKGRPIARVAFVTTSRLQLVSIARAPGAFVRGATRGGTVAIGLPLFGPGLHLQRSEWNAGCFGYVSRGGEFELVSPRPNRILALAVDGALLDTMAREHLGRSIPATLAGTCLRVKGEAERRTAVATWVRWLSAGIRDPALLLDPAMASRMESEVLGSLLGAVVCDCDTPPPRPRRELALRAEAHIRERLAEAPGIDDISAAMRTSPRSLHASFQTVFGIPPKAYQRALRLSAVRRDLLAARPGTTVSEVAMRWNFLQLGYFAGDYRRMFGEGPRDTLRRGRARGAMA
jgi:AraC family transcriptional regulator, ethanolamine operon transcriptional activator